MQRPPTVLLLILGFFYYILTLLRKIFKAEFAQFYASLTTQMPLYHRLLVNPEFISPSFPFLFNIKSLQLCACSDSGDT